MDDAEAVDFIVAWFFLYHHVYDSLPTIVCKAVADGIVYECNMGRDDLLALGIKELSFNGGGIEAVGVEEGLVVT